jgi:predicted PP-loop superfamily ATPase
MSVMGKELEERLNKLLKGSARVPRDVRRQQLEIAAATASGKASSRHTDPVLRRAGLLVVPASDRSCVDESR